MSRKAAAGRAADHTHTGPADPDRLDASDTAGRQPAPALKPAKLSSHPSGDDLTLDMPSPGSISQQTSPGKKLWETPFNSGTAGQEVSFWQSLQTRETKLGILSMSLLIFQGTALSLTLRFSR